MSVLVDLVNQVETYNAILPAAHTVTTQSPAIDMTNCHVAIGAVVSPGVRSTQTSTFAVQIEECATTNGTFVLIPGMIQIITTSGVAGGVPFRLRGQRTERYVRGNIVTCTGTTPSCGVQVDIISQRKVSGAGTGEFSGVDRAPSTYSGAVMPLVTIAGVKQHLGINPSDGAEDTALSALIANAEAVVQEWCGRKFASGEVTEFYSGNGTSYLFLRRRPVSEIDSIYSSEQAFWGQATDAFGATTLLTEGTDYALEIDGDDGLSYCGTVHRLNGLWEQSRLHKPGVIGGTLAPGRGNIKVTYTGGFEAIPYDVQLACYLMIAAVRNSRNYGQLLRNESSSDGAGSSSYGIAAQNAIGIMTPEVMSLLAKYRNVAVA